MIVKCLKQVGKCLNTSKIILTVYKATKFNQTCCQLFTSCLKYSNYSKQSVKWRWPKQSLHLFVFCSINPQISEIRTKKTVFGYNSFTLDGKSATISDVPIEQTSWHKKNIILYCGRLSSGHIQVNKRVAWFDKHCVCQTHRMLLVCGF